MIENEAPSNGEVKTDDMAEAIESIKTEIRERREKLGDKIIFAYENGEPLHKIEKLKAQLRDFDETIKTFDK